MAERCGRKTKGDVGKQRGLQVFIPMKKAAGGAMPGALPEEATLKSFVVSPSPKIAYPGRYEHRNNAPSQGDI